MEAGSASATPARMDSKRRFVDAGVELTLEHYESGTGLRDVFAFMTPGAVAARAGLSRALLYHHWGGSTDADAGPDAFAAYLREVAAELWGMPSKLHDFVEDASDLPLNRSDLVREICDLELARGTGSARSIMRASESLTLHGLTPTVEAEAVVGRLSEMYRVLGEMTGLEPVPPLGFDDVATAVSCIYEGHILGMNNLEDRLLARHDWVPVTPEEQPGKGWTLLAISVEAVLERMLRPVDPAGTTDGDTTDGDD